MTGSWSSPYDSQVREEPAEGGEAGHAVHKQVFRDLSQRRETVAAQLGDGEAVVLREEVKGPDVMDLSTEPSSQLYSICPKLCLYHDIVSWFCGGRLVKRETNQVEEVRRNNRWKKETTRRETEKERDIILIFMFLPGGSAMDKIEKEVRKKRNREKETLHQFPRFH